MQIQRLHRFERSPVIRGIQITERDVQILQMVYRHRFLSSRQITRLLSGSTQTVLRRLRLLFHHGYLERPRCQLDYYNKAGSRPIVYGLGNKGAAALEQQHAPGIERLRWGEKNLNIGRAYLEHALLVAEFMVRLEIACRRVGVRLLYESDLNYKTKSNPARSMFRWKVNFNGKTFGVIPDRTFGLEFSAPEGSASRSYFFLEADRGTMPIIRKDLSQSSLCRKLIAYQTTWSSGIHREQFGFHRFRVLTITSSPSRVQAMLQACRKLERGRGLFLFSDRSILEIADKCIFTTSWQTAKPGVMGNLLA